MKFARYILSISIVALFFSACVNDGFTQSNVGELSQIYRGTVTYAQVTRIKDSGGGALLGALVGGVAGHTLSDGNGVATAGGAVGGAAIGSALNRDKGQEVVVRLDDGREVRSLLKVNRKDVLFTAGDRVKVYVAKNHVRRIELIFDNKASYYYGNAYNGNSPTTTSSSREASYESYDLRKERDRRLDELRRMRENHTISDDEYFLEKRKVLNGVGGFE